MSGSSLDFLFSLEKFGIKLGLAGMTRLCDALDHPERAFTSVHVAGTNGKGSVCAMVERALRAAGHRAARYTSPHLVRVSERFVVDGREIDAETLERGATRVRLAAERLVETGALPAWPTFFECTTALAFDLFREAGVEVAVIEVGLGGRLDATNVVTPAVCAIVSIDFDHQAQLGNTIASIAAEKAGIIKPGVPVVCGALPPDAARVITDVAAANAAPLVDAIADARLLARLRSMPLALKGEHQVGNAAVAVRVLEQLNGRGVTVSGADIDEGLIHAEWPGRLESVERGGTRVLFDAAHNPAGARALAEYVRGIAPDGATLVIGVMKDKAAAEMVSIVAPIARRILCTQAPTPRAMEAAALADLARAAHPRVETVPDPYEALARATEDDRIVVVAGSIFLVGPLRERLSRGILR